MPRFQSPIPSPAGFPAGSFHDACLYPLLLPSRFAYTDQNFSYPVPMEYRAMPPLERLFLLEVEFHRRLRTEAPGTADARSLHTSYALQSGYEPLIRSAHRITGRAIEGVYQLHLLTADPRDLLAARDTLKQLLGLSQLDT